MARLNLRRGKRPIATRRSLGGNRVARNVYRCLRRPVRGAAHRPPPFVLPALRRLASPAGSASAALPPVSMAAVLPRDPSAGRADWLALGAGGDNVFPDVSHEFPPESECLHCWHQCASFNNAGTTTIGPSAPPIQVVFFAVVCVADFSFPAVLIQSTDLLAIDRWRENSGNDFE